MKIIDRSVLGVMFFGAVLGGIAAPVATVEAQDLLPEDNGIFTYHRAPRYRESESHPLRIAAYVVHPFGWILREAITRPLSAFTSSTPFTRSFFGYREPFDYRQPFCYLDPAGIPNCRELAPFNALSKGGDGTDGTDGGTDHRIYFPDVAFEFDKSRLTALGRARVRQVSQLLAAAPSVKVVVEGHTDNVGTDDYNQKLGTRRAQTVVKELTELGIDPARMSPISYGESRPLFTEDTDWARAANRRVQFTVQGNEPAPAPSETASASDLPAAKK